MFIVNIEFITKLLYEDVGEWIDNLVHNMHHQGRIVHLRNNIYEQEDCIVVQCKIPEFDSISAISENRWAKELEDKNVLIQVKCLGKYLVSPDLCCCEQTEFYILLGSEHNPLLCGYCGGMVPLYRIPATYEPDPSYYDINCWNKENMAWSDLEFYSDHEALAQKELANLYSRLNKKALELRIKIENKSGKNCYYFLERLQEPTSFETATKEKCPGCGGKWLLDQPLLECYDFKCDYCKILSQLPPGIKRA